MPDMNNDDPLGAFLPEQSVPQRRPMRARDRLAPPVAGASAQEACAVDTVLVDDDNELSTIRPAHPLQNTSVGINAESTSVYSKEDDSQYFSSKAYVLSS